VEQLEARTLLTSGSYTAATVSDLINDINQANQGGGGTSTITLTAATTSPYILTAVDNKTDGPTGLPVIKNKDTLTIVGNGDTIERSTASGTPDFRLFDVASGASLTLQTLTLENGLEDGSGNSAEGGALYNQGTLILSGVTVQDNTAQGSAGSPNNSANKAAGAGADAQGGGIWSNGTLTLENGTTIQSNLAVGGVGGAPDRGTGGTGGRGSGGGLYVAGGTAIITSTTFSSNTAKGGLGGQGNFGSGGAGADGSGGGLYVLAGTITLIGVALENNTALGGEGGPHGFVGDDGSGGNGFGGGLEVAGGSVTVSSDTLVEYNTARGGVTEGRDGTGYGGGIYVAGGSVTLCNDTVEYNTATGGTLDAPATGGGIYIASGATVYIDTSSVDAADPTVVTNNTDSSGLNGSTADIDGTYIFQNC
jgi:hypothetical protein